MTDLRAVHPQLATSIRPSCRRWVKAAQGPLLPSCPRDARGRAAAERCHPAGQFFEPFQRLFKRAVVHGDQLLGLEVVEGLSGLIETREPLAEGFGVQGGCGEIVEVGGLDRCGLAIFDNKSY